jgi:hypothetical protein
MMVLVGAYLSYASARRIFPVRGRALKGSPEEREQRPNTDSDLYHETPSKN